MEAASKGKGKSKDKQRSLRPRKSNTSLAEADLEAAAFRFVTETFEEPVAETVISKKGKGKKRKVGDLLQISPELKVSGEIGDNTSGNCHFKCKT